LHKKSLISVLILISLLSMHGLTLPYSQSIMPELELVIESGDNQYCAVNSSPAEDLVMRIRYVISGTNPPAKDGKAITFPSVPVKIDVIDPDGISIKNETISTDNNGIGTYNFTTGIKPGTYIAKASINSTEYPEFSGRNEIEFNISTQITITNSNGLWFLGDSVQGVSSTLTVTKVNNATYEYSVINGGDKVDLENLGQDFYSSSDEYAYLCNIIPRKDSEIENDVRIQVSINNVIVGTIDLTVNMVTGVEVMIGSPQDWPVNGAYYTVYNLQVVSKFPSIPPSNIEFNEDFGIFSDDINNDWPDPLPDGNVLTSSGTFTDTYGWIVYNGQPSNFMPRAVEPTDPSANNHVKHAQQIYRIGSWSVGEGKIMGQHTIQYNLGNARQLR
jgi:hypothetical protein